MSLLTCPTAAAKFGFVPTLRRTIAIAVTVLALTAYADTLIEADRGLCFGRDGHAGLERVVDHQVRVDFSSEALLSVADHGSCVDVVMAARKSTERLPAATPPAATGLGVDPVPPSRAHGTDCLRAPGGVRSPSVVLRV